MRPSTARCRRPERSASSRGLTPAPCAASRAMACRHRHSTAPRQRMAWAGHRTPASSSTPSSGIGTRCASSRTASMSTRSLRPSGTPTTRPMRTNATTRWRPIAWPAARHPSTSRSISPSSWRPTGKTPASGRVWKSSPYGCSSVQAPRKGALAAGAWTAPLNRCVMAPAARLQNAKPRSRIGNGWTCTPAARPRCRHPSPMHPWRLR